MKNKLKKIWNIASTVIVVLTVLCAVFLVGSRLMGHQVYTVISGSMEPIYNVGDLIYVKEVDVNTIKIGDDITYIMNKEGVISTHRVIGIDAETQHFQTKGINNNTVDTPVHFKNVLGVPQFRIRYLGYVANFIQNPPGTYITIAVGAVLILLVFLPDFLPKKKEEQETPVEDAAQEENARLREELEALKAQLQQAPEKEQ